MKKQKQHDVNVRALAQLMPHRREVHQPDLRHDALAESMFGRLRLNKKIDEEQYAAGLLLRRAVRRMRRVLSAPSFDARTLVLDGVRYSSTSDVDEQRAKDWKQAHERVYADLICNVGVPITQLLTRTVVHDHGCADHEIENLCRGLDRLVLFYRVKRNDAA